MKKLLKFYISFLLLIAFVNSSMSQTLDFKNLIVNINKNNDSLNFNLLDSFFTEYINKHPELDERKFNDLIRNFYIEDNNNTLAAYYFVGGLYFEKSSNYTAAIKSYLTAIEFLSKNINSKNYLIYYRTAYCYESLGFSQKAIDYYLKSISYQNIQKEKRVEIYKNLGNCYVGLKKFDKSILYYNKSYNVAKIIGDSISMVKNILNMGNTYLRTKNYLKAIESTEKAYKLASLYNYQLGTSFAMLNLGLIYSKKNENQKATKYFLKAINISKKYNVAYVYFNAQLYISRSYLTLKEYDKALKYINYCITHINKNIPEKKKLICYRIQFEALFKSQKTEAAFKSLNKLNKLTDSILKSNQKNYMQNVESNRKLEKNIFENRILVKKLEINKLKILQSKKILWLNLFVLSLLIIIISQLIFSRKKQNKFLRKILHQNKIIAEKNTEISLQSEELRSKNESLYEYQQKLELLVEDRTKKLNKALILVKEQSEIKSAFLKNISHEIRTPLNAIMGFIQIISLNNTEVEQKYLKIINQNGNDLINTVDNLIELADIETREIELQKKEIPLSQFINKIKTLSNLIQNNAIKNNINFIIDTHGIQKDSSIFTDEKILQRILSQLIHNAFKYTEKGSVRIYFDLDVSRLNIEVEDTGVGMDEKHLNQIFDRFLKIESENKFYRGTGAGLAIVKKLSEKINLKIETKSKLKQGTSFILSLSISEI